MGVPITGGALRRSQLAPVPWMSLRGPGGDTVADLVTRARHAELTYPHHGATWSDMPAGWDTSEDEVVLGRGEAVWRRARLALTTWSQFDLTWVRPHRRDVPLEAGEVFAFSSRQYGLWTVNLCRIVEVRDEEDAAQSRYGFAYGTVGTHMLRGEERFLVSWDRETDVVSFGIRRFSRPAHWVLRLAGPLMKRAQDRFLTEATARFEQEVRT